MDLRPAHPTYEDAVTYLNSLQSPYTVVEDRRNNPPPNLQQSEVLQEMNEWVREIGYQPTDFDRINVVHVAGTKGKGTTCAFVNSILAQYHDRYGIPKKFGLYTSPHLLSVCERIRINSRPISEEKFVQYFFEVWDKMESSAKKKGRDPRVKPSYFRYLTLLSFHVFVREEIDIAIYEVGVGGEFDSTNVVVSPIATGITSLGIDHVIVLGRTIEEIAWHKAGIFKNGSPAYTVWQPESGMEVLRRRAEEKSVHMLEIPIANCLRDVKIQPDEDFQRRNASLAIVLAARALAHLDFSQGNNTFSQDLALIEDGNIDLDRPLPEEFKTGLTNTVWRGRGEIIVKSYGRWFIDGAHTAESLEIVCDWFGRTIQKATAEEGKDPLCVLVFNQQGGSRDAKQLIATVQRTLDQKWHLNIQEAIFCTNITYKTKRYKADFVDNNTDPSVVDSLTIQHVYADHWRQAHPNTSIRVLSSIQEAVDSVREISAANADRPVYILTTGSFRLIGGILTVLEGEKVISTESATRTG